MKRINYNFLFTSIMAVFMLASCSSTKYGAHFQPSSHPSYAHVKQDKSQAPVLEARQEEASSKVAEKIARRSGAEEVQPDALPSIGSLKDLKGLEMPAPGELSLREQEVLAETKERLKNMSREEKRALRKEIKNIKLLEYRKNLPAYARDMGIAQEDISENELVIILLTVLLPPLGVYLHQGEINNKFWITLVLWLLFYFPGLIYGLIVVLGD